MNIDSAFPSPFIKASDLQGRDIPLTMREVKFEKVGDDDQKPVLYFQGTEKGMVLNKTNANTIKIIYGVETSAWIGQQIVLYLMKVEFKGDLVDAIRCKAVVGVLQPPSNGGLQPTTPTEPAPAVSATDAPTPPAPPPQSATAAGLPDLGEDEIPF